MNLNIEDDSLDILSVCMLGNFELSYQTKTLKEMSNRSHKLWNLLGYLITYHSRAIPQSEFIDVIWPDSEGINPLSALKTSFSRLRTFLLPIAPAQADFVLSSRGSYQWNESLPIHLDIEYFSFYCEQGSDKKKSNEERITSYKKAIALYNGDFLPRLKDEFWVIPLATHYHSLYVEAAKSLYLLLKQENLLDEMVDYCTKALSIESFDEMLHCNLIEALSLHGNLPAALAHYQKATEILYQNISVQPSTALNFLYRSLMQAQSELEMDTSLIINKLKEVGARQGAFICDFGVFEEIYRLEARQVLRSKTTSYICILTIIRNNRVPALDILNIAMPKLLSSIIDSLRSGDVVTKYSGAQYILLLPFVDSSNANKIIERIQENYYHKHKKSTLHLKYELFPLT